MKSQLFMNAYHVNTDLKLNINISTLSKMRLQFPLKKVKISPVCHIQLNRHAEQFRGRYTIGQLYGALYDDEAHITNILPFPEGDNTSSRQQLETMERRHEDMINKYGLDNSNIGWYLVSYKQSLWEQLEIVKYYEKFINTSFMLVYDYEAAQIGRSPYRVYRLTDQFALTEEFSYKNIKINANQQIESPFIQIPVEIEKNELFEALILFNKKRLLKEFTSQRSALKSNKNYLESNVETYLSSLGQQVENNRRILEKQANKEDKNVTFNEYCENLGILLKTEKQEECLKNYGRNIEESKKLLIDLGN